MSKTEVKKVRKIVTEDDRKKRRKILLITAASVLAVILAVGIILGCVPAKSFLVFDGYESVIFQSRAADRKTVENVTEDSTEKHDQFVKNDILKKGVRKGRYSYLRAVFEGRFSNSFKLEKTDEEYEDSKGNTKTRKINNEIRITQIDGRIPRTLQDNEFILEFVYARTADDKPARTIKAGGLEQAYDRAKIFVKADPNNIIEEFTVFFYDSAMMPPRNDETAEMYKIVPVIIRGRGTPLVKNLNDLVNYLVNNG